MARERHNFNIKCHGCGQTGLARESENDYPFMRSRDRSVSILEGEFKAIEHPKDEDAFTIQCKQCNASWVSR